MTEAYADELPGSPALVARIATADNNDRILRQTRYSSWREGPSHFNDGFISQSFYAADTTNFCIVYVCYDALVYTSLTR